MSASPFPVDIGIEIIEESPERAVTSLVVEQRHCNAHGIIHGGAVFTLADTAFGLAMNAGDEQFVAMEMHVRFLRPTMPGQRLVATATRLHWGRQTSFYRIEVVDEKNRHIASLTGTGHVLGQAKQA
jgi:acyl-CoA thioesterase